MSTSSESDRVRMESEGLFTDLLNGVVAVDGLERLELVRLLVVGQDRLYVAGIVNRRVTEEGFIRASDEKLRGILSMQLEKVRDHSGRHPVVEH